jgi:hypothetical protein
MSKCLTPIINLKETFWMKGFVCHSNRNSLSIIQMINHIHGYNIRHLCSEMDV